MSNKFTELTDDFSTRAKKYAGGQIHFMIDGSSVATDGYMFEREDTDPVTEALGIAREVKDALPDTGVTAAFWSGQHPRVDINLMGSPAAWFKKIPKGSGHLVPALDEVSRAIAAGEMKSPLHLVITHQFFGADEATVVKSALKKLQQTPGVTLDVIIHTDTNLQINNIVQSLTAEDPSKPVGHYRILTPEQLRDAVRDAAYSPVEAQLQQENAVKAISTAATHGTAEITAPALASFKKK